MSFCCNLRRLTLAARLHKRRRMRFSARLHVLPGLFRQRNSRRRKLRIAIQKKSNQLLAKLFHALRRETARQRIHCIFHRVGGKNLAVVAFHEAATRNRPPAESPPPFAKIVPVTMPLHFHHADPRLAVPIFRQRLIRSASPVRRIAVRAQQQRNVKMRFALAHLKRNLHNRIAIPRFLRVLDSSPCRTISGKAQREASSPSGSN